jgi:hypothetical protein
LKDATDQGAESIFQSGFSIDKAFDMAIKYGNQDHSVKKRRGAPSID